MFVEAITEFTEKVGCTTKEFNERQTALYTGLQCEELAEKLDAITANAIENHYLNSVIAALHSVSFQFKNGNYDKLVAKANREDMLDADIDLAWVSIGSALSQGADVQAACAEVSRANLAKVNPLVKDENGKVVKPAGWTPPDLSKCINGATVDE